MDYRVPLFELLSDRFEIKFLFQHPSNVSHDFESICASDVGRIKIPGLALAFLSFRDLHSLCSGVRWSDVFVSSFVWNSYSMIGLILCKLFNKRIVVWEEINVLLPGFKFKVQHALMRILCRHVDAFFVMGDLQKSTLMRLGVGAEHVFVGNEYPGHIYSEVDAHEIELPFDKEVAIIMLHGRLVEFKGVEYLIRAFQTIERERNDVALVVVGYGPLREHLESLSKVMRLVKIHFAGDIADIHARAYLLERRSIGSCPFNRSRKRCMKADH